MRIAHILVSWVLGSCLNRSQAGMKKDEKERQDESKGYLNKGEEDEMEIIGFEPHAPAAVVTWVLYFASFGFLRLFFHWNPKYKLYATHRRCPLSRATTVLVIDNYEKRFKSIFVEKIKTVGWESWRSNGAKGSNAYFADGSNRDLTIMRRLIVKKHTFVWVSEKNEFIQLVGLDNGTCKEDLYQFSGYTREQQQQIINIYGFNDINVPISSITSLIILEILDPFYMFQLFSILVWVLDNYYYYCAAIVIMSVFGIFTSVYQTHKNQKNLNRMTHKTDVVTIRRSSESYEDVPTTELVPGDIIVVPAHGCTIYCDAVLLNGNCIVNESMLTGESVPVTKTPIGRHRTPYNIKDDSRHTLFSGTEVIQTRSHTSEKVHAVVIRTGFLTAKGRLVRSILYPPPADFKFDKDSYKFIWVMATVGLAGFFYSLYIQWIDGDGIFYTIIDSLDLLTIAIPPALPASMTVGKIYALKRIKKHKISCINSRVINVSGSLNCVCFDKTGTLTEDGLDMWGVLESDKVLGDPIRQVSSLAHGPFLYGLASCHSLTLINNQVTGDPLDVKMLESTKWTLEEPELQDQAKYDLLVPTLVRSGGTEIAILHQFQFSSKLQRMSVVTRMLEDPNLTLYCKGSPEMIISLSKPETVPDDIVLKLKDYTQQGYRVIALGWRHLGHISYHKLDKIRREEVEVELHFSGLIIFENRLKPQTIPTIQTLKEANIKIVMITGDNIQTAISVANECGMIDCSRRAVELSLDETGLTCHDIVGTKAHLSEKNSGELIFGRTVIGREIEVKDLAGIHAQFAATGKVWAWVRERHPEHLAEMAARTVIFARMSGEQKQQVVTELQGLGYCVGMCGDGANDCGALKAAHVGISLSEAEASVASPFTSQEQNISCVITVIKEGRAALVTSFGVFKFMVLYCFAEFFSTVFLYHFRTNLTDFEFIFIDIGLIVNFAFFFGRTWAFKGKLTRNQPQPSILSAIPVTSLCCQVFLIAVFQLTSYYIVTMFPWFVPYAPANRDSSPSYENYSVFTISSFQYIIIAIVCSVGPPYRQPIYTNRLFFASLILMTVLAVYVTFYPAPWVISLFGFKFPPFLDFPAVVLLLASSNLGLALFVEEFVVNYILHRKLGVGYSRSSHGQA